MEQPTLDQLDIIFLIDRSGSMSGSETDTIGGFNSYIKREKENGFKTKVTTILFDHQYEVLYSRKDINEVCELTDKEYYVRGSTALLDAIGKTINTLDKEIDNKVLFIIMTDGYENSSVEYNKTQIKNLINNHQWEFIYIGADIDSYAEAASIGIRKSRTANYNKSKEGYDDLFTSVENASKTLRKADTLDFSDWDENLRKYD